MTTFFRLMNAADKQAGLADSIANHNSGLTGSDSYDVDPSEFFNVPGAPFAYWVSGIIRHTFRDGCLLESDQRTAKQGLATGDDTRFVRLFWEVKDFTTFFLFSKGGEFSPFYYDVHLAVNWSSNGCEIKALFTSLQMESKLHVHRQQVFIDELA